MPTASSLHIPPGDKPPGWKCSRKCPCALRDRAASGALGSDWSRYRPAQDSSAAWLSASTQRIASSTVPTAHPLDSWACSTLPLCQYV